MKIIENITDSDYRAMEGLSQSELGWLLQSPLHFQHRKDERLTKETDSMRFGRALHMAILETEKFKNTYGVLPEFWGTTKDGRPSTQSKDAKEKKAEFLKNNPQKIWVDQDEMDKLTGMLMAVATHPDIQEEGLLIGGQNEVVATWEREGRKCKGRFDKFHSNHPLRGRCMVEIKSANNASQKIFKNEFHNFDYDFQASYYDYAAQCDNYIVIAIESKFPYPIGIYNVKHWLDLGTKKVQTAFDRLKDCETNNRFYGYTKGVEDLLPPSWLVGQHQELTQEEI